MPADRPLVLPSDPVSSRKVQAAISEYQALVADYRAELARLRKLESSGRAHRLG